MRPLLGMLEPSLELSFTSLVESRNTIAIRDFFGTAEGAILNASAMVGRGQTWLAGSW